LRWKGLFNLFDGDGRPVDGGGPVDSDGKKILIQESVFKSVIIFF